METNIAVSHHEPWNKGKLSDDGLLEICHDD